MDPLATLEDFGDRVQGGVLAADTARAQAMLVDASALIRAEAGKTWDPADETIPEAAKTICMSAAKRAFLNPDGVRSIAIDGNSATFGSPDVYLTAAEKTAIRRVAGKSSLWTQSTTRSDTADGEMLDTPHVQDGDEVIDAGPLSDFFP